MALSRSRVSVPLRGFRGLQVAHQTREPGLPADEFQSPSGVLGVCRDSLQRRARGFTPLVSVPFRGFRGLQVSPAATGRRWMRRVFQSPSGVLGVCREGASKLPPVARVAFQSPSGVLGVCRAEERSVGFNCQVVSVPFRGFRGLQAKSKGSRLAPSLPGFSPLPGF